MTDINAHGLQWKQYDDTSGHMTAFILEPPPRKSHEDGLTINMGHETIAISALIGDHLVTRRYSGYSRREAVRQFRNEFPR